MLQFGEKNPKPNCDISASEIESEAKEVILFTTTNNSDNDSYLTDSSADEEAIVNTYIRTCRRQGNWKNRQWLGK